MEEEILFGLTDTEVEARRKAGRVNSFSSHTTKSIPQIIRDNVFSLFNLINVVLAVLIALTGSYRNGLFIILVICNSSIGIFQEIRTKLQLDKIRLIVSPHAKVIRNGRFEKIPVSDVVTDDVMIIKRGYQVVADCRIISGFVTVNESLLTGESFPVPRKEGDFVYSGSIITAGQGFAGVTAVGPDSYAMKITGNARKKEKYKSELKSILDKIIKYIGLAIVPIGILLFLKQYFIMHTGFDEAVLSLSTTLIGMIPEGLVILTSVSLAVGIYKLARHNILVQELFCLETIARVDTVCFDKTGTLTKGIMQVEKYVDLTVTEEKKSTGSGYEEIHPKKTDVNLIMGNLLNASEDDNPTIHALKKMYITRSEWTVKKTIPFDSSRKFSGVVFEEGIYLIGAYSFLFSDNDSMAALRIREQEKKGKRVLCLATTDEESLKKEPELMGFFVIVDELRESTQNVLKYFKEQDVNLKIISGDSPLTVSETARRASFTDYKNMVDASKLSDDMLKDAVENYSVFGRVTPEQKKNMVEALRENSHYTAMTGDGVNDVMALKKAHVSIAMADGSDIAKDTANLLLLDSDFNSIPFALDEGRRVINNIRKVAALFLTKTIYSCMLSVFYLIFPFQNPLMPVHLTFISALTIGIPAFFLAMEPNRKRVRGHFDDDIRKISIPAATGAAFSQIFCVLYASFFKLDEGTVSFLCVLSLCFCGFMVLFKVCRPFDAFRRMLFFVLIVMAAAGLIFFHELILLRAFNLMDNIVCIAVSFAIEIFVSIFIKHLTIHKNK